MEDVLVQNKSIFVDLF